MHKLFGLEEPSNETGLIRI
jgi:hypothetical protein